jgi:hypothetical protein
MSDHHHHQGPGLSPVLDIGGEVGALIVYLATRPATGELHARRASSPADPAAGVGVGARSGLGRSRSDSGPASTHTGVHPRDIDGTMTWVALYPELVEGAYHLLDEAGAPMAQVAVSGGQVEQIDLR